MPDGGPEQLLPTPQMLIHSAGRGAWQRKLKHSGNFHSTDVRNRNNKQQQQQHKVTTMGEKSTKMKIKDKFYAGREGVTVRQKLPYFT